MIVNKEPKSANIYICEKCDFKCSKKSNYKRHIETAKHKMIVNGSEKSSAISDIHTCVCGKTYKYESGYYRHKKTCDFNTKIQNTNQMIQSMDSNIVIELLKQNQEFKELMVDQNKQIQDQNKQIQQTQEKNNDLQKQLLEVVKDGKTITNNNITNNNRFNLNVFLNEKCKDAINLNDFIKSIELNTDDFIRTGENGFVKGISHVMVERIRDMDPLIRPIHCTDLKREIVYVKDSNKWEKEDANKTTLRKAVQIVANKNQQQLYPWQDQNPDYDRLNTPECEKFFIYAKESLGGYGAEEDAKFENKIISNVLKEVVIDKHAVE